MSYIQHATNNVPYYVIACRVEMTISNGKGGNIIVSYTAYAFLTNEGHIKFCRGK